MALLVLAAGINDHVAVQIHADIQHDRSAAHLAVFYVALLWQGIIGQYDLAFSAVRATDVSFAELVAIFGDHFTSVR